MIADPALLLIDMQNDFCKPGYAYVDEENPEVEAAIDNASRFLERYRESGRTPILVRTTHDETTTSPVWMAKYYRRGMEDIPCRPGTEGARLVPELNRQESDCVVTKHRYSAFYNTRLETILSSNDVSELLIGGVNTDICVASSVHGAFNRDYDVTVLSDCSAGSSVDNHDLFARHMDGRFGSVTESSEIDLEPV